MTTHQCDVLEASSIVRDWTPRPHQRSQPRCVQEAAGPKPEQQCRSLAVVQERMFELCGSWELLACLKAKVSTHN